MHTVLHDHMLAKIGFYVSHGLCLEVRFVFKKLTDRTRTHFFGASGDVGEETTQRLDYTPDCCAHVVCSWS